MPEAPRPDHSQASISIPDHLEWATPPLSHRDLPELLVPLRQDHNDTFYVTVTSLVEDLDITPGEDSVKLWTTPDPHEKFSRVGASPNGVDIPDDPNDPELAYYQREPTLLVRKTAWPDVNEDHDRATRAVIANGNSALVTIHEQMLADRFGIDTREYPKKNPFLFEPMTSMWGDDFALEPVGFASDIVRTDDDLALPIPDDLTTEVASKAGLDAGLLDRRLAKLARTLTPDTFRAVGLKPIGEPLVGHAETGPVALFQYPFGSLQEVMLRFYGVDRPVARAAAVAHQELATHLVSTGQIQSNEESRPGRSAGRESVVIPLDRI